MLISATVLTTVSFLTAKDSVTNTFTAGKVSLKLDEAAVDEYGVKIDGAERVTENQYRLIPGMTYAKDPTVTVLTGSEASYIRIMMTVHNFSEYDRAIVSKLGTGNYLGMFEGLDENVWSYLGHTTSNADNTATFEFRYVGTPDGHGYGEEGNVLEPLFESFTLPDTLTGEELEALYGTEGDFKITLEAHAIQAAGFDTEKAAWKAFEQQMTSQTAAADSEANS